MSTLKEQLLFLLTKNGQLSFTGYPRKELAKILDQFQNENFHLVGEKIFAILNDLEEPPLCICGNYTKFNRVSSGYFKYCSPSCASKATCLRGSDHPLASPERKKKIRELVEAGEYHTQKAETKSKIKAANLATYKERELPTRLDELEKTGYTLVSEFDGRFEAQKWKHSCGATFDAIPNSRYEVHCPSCKRANVTLPHQLLAQIFPEAKVNDRTVIGPKELDLLFEKEKIAVEVNGIYFHSDQSKSADYHKQKLLACTQKGVRLLQFWDYEVNCRLELVTSMINSALGRNKRIFARKCKFVEVAKEEANAFIEANHLSGSTTFSKAYGLRLNNELVCCMSVGTARFGDRSFTEIIRFCTKQNLVVVGGFSRIVYNLPYSKIVSYQDGRLGFGKMYENAGFHKEAEMSPNYAYFKGTVRLSRQQAMKHKLPKLLGDKFDSELTEKQNMRNAGWNICYDAGHLKWILEKEI